MQVDISRSITVLVNTTDDQSINSDQSESLSWNDSVEIATDAPVNCVSSISDQDIESLLLTSEASMSIEESSPASSDNCTVTSPDISLLTGSESEKDVHSSPEKSSGTKQLDCQRQDSSIEAQPKPGYKIVIDNIDKNVKPRNMRVDAQTKSLHYVQMYSVKDRIDFGKLSDIPLQVRNVWTIFSQALITMRNSRKISRFMLAV